MNAPTQRTEETVALLYGTDNTHWDSHLSSPTTGRLQYKSGKRKATPADSSRRTVTIIGSSTDIAIITEPSMKIHKQPTSMRC